MIWKGVEIAEEPIDVPMVLRCSSEPVDTPTPTTTPAGGAYRIYLPLVFKNCAMNLLSNGNFETGVLSPWGSGGAVSLGSGRNSDYGAWLGGVNDAEGELVQGVAIPAGISPVVRLKFRWLAESASEQPNDAVEVLVQYGDEQTDQSDLPAPHLEDLPLKLEGVGLGQRNKATCAMDTGGFIVVFLRGSGYNACRGYRFHKGRTKCKPERWRL